MPDIPVWKTSLDIDVEAIHLMDDRSARKLLGMGPPLTEEELKALQDSM